MNYKTDFTLESLCNDFVRYAESNGIRITTDFARQIFSALSASKLLLFPDGSYFYKYLVHVLSGYFGYELFLDNINGEWSGADRIAMDDFGGETHVTKGVAYSVNNPKTLTAVALFGVDFAKTDYIDSLCGYLRAPKLDWTFKAGLNSYKLGENLFLFLVADKSAGLKSSLGKYGTYVESANLDMINNFERLRANGYSGDGQMVIAVNNSELLSLDVFDDLVSTALENNGISLEYWKKLDKVEAYLNKLCGYQMDNIEARQLERYIATFTALGGNEIQAVDSALAYKILPLLYGYDRSKFNYQAVRLSDFIIDLLGEENAMLSAKLLRKMGL